MGVVLGMIISLNGIVSGATIATGFAGYIFELVNILPIFLHFLFVSLSQQ